LLFKTIPITIKTNRLIISTYTVRYIAMKLEFRSRKKHRFSAGDQRVNKISLYI